MASSWGKIEAGVPQGSVLGPLLFLVFINDITYVIRNCKIRLFADDTCLYIEVDNHVNAAKKVNEDLALIQDWSKTWLVSFSPQKTKDMTITNKAQINYPPLTLDGEIIEQVKSHKHLGVTFTSDLGWKTHAYNIGKKAYNCIGILRPLKMRLDRRTLEILYKSFIRPVLEYADILWHIAADNRHALDILERVQLEATRRCPTAELYKEVAWETLKSRREMHRSAMMYKIDSGKASSYLIDLLTNQIEARTLYNLRNQRDYRVPFARLETYSHSFFPAAIRIWNVLPDSVKEAPSDHAFKARYLKQYPRPKSNHLYYSGTRAENVAHAKMRIGCSLLNYDLATNLHVIEDPNCRCIMGVPETSDHYLLQCPWFMAARIKMYAELLMIPNLPTICNDLLLYGDNSLDDQTNLLIFKLVHQFITETNRFSPTPNP